MTALVSGTSSCAAFETAGHKGIESPAPDRRSTPNSVPAHSVPAHGRRQPPAGETTTVPCRGIQPSVRLSGEPRRDSSDVVSVCLWARIAVGPEARRLRVMCVGRAPSHASGDVLEHFTIGEPAVGRSVMVLIERHRTT